MERLAGGPMYSEYYSTNVTGLIRNIKSIFKSINIEESCKMLAQSGTKRTDIKRTLIGI